MTAPEAARLAPCPFCGGACAVTKGYSTSELPWSDDGGDFYRVYCSSCQSRQLFHRTADEAIEAWNRRAALSQPDEARWQAARQSALEEAAKTCEERYLGDNNREDFEARRCAAAIRSLANPAERPEGEKT